MLMVLPIKVTGFSKEFEGGLRDIAARNHSKAVASIHEEIRRYYPNLPETPHVEVSITIQGLITTTTVPNEGAGEWVRELP